MKDILRKCMNCEKDYKHNNKCKYSIDIKEYCKYLGCCCLSCFTIIPRPKRNRLVLGAYIENNKN